MRKLFLISILVVGALLTISLIFIGLAYAFPWNLTIKNTGCNDMNIPPVNYYGFDLLKMTSGQNPIRSGNQSSFNIPSIPTGAYLLINGIEEQNSLVVQGGSGALTSPEYTIDVSNYLELRFNGINVIGRPYHQVDINNLIVEYVCSA